MRFLRNKSPKDCCIIAILNACKFFGQKVSYKDHAKDLKQALLYNSKFGCPTRLFIDFVKSIHIHSNFDIKTLAVSHKGNLASINKVISKNLIAMVIVDGHVFLVTEVKKNSYKVINFYRNKTISYIPKKKFTNLMKSASICLWIKQNKH